MTGVTVERVRASPGEVAGGRPKPRLDNTDAPGAAPWAGSEGEGGGIARRAAERRWSIGLTDSALSAGLTALSTALG